MDILWHLLYTINGYSIRISSNFTFPLSEDISDASTTKGCVNPHLFQWEVDGKAHEWDGNIACRRAYYGIGCTQRRAQKIILNILCQSVILVGNLEPYISVGHNIGTLEYPRYPGQWVVRSVRWHDVPIFPGKLYLYMSLCVVKIPGKY